MAISTGISLWRRARTLGTWVLTALLLIESSSELLKWPFSITSPLHLDQSLGHWIYFTYMYTSPARDMPQFFSAPNPYFIMSPSTHSSYTPWLVFSSCPMEETIRPNNFSSTSHHIYTYMKTITTTQVFISKQATATIYMSDSQRPSLIHSSPLKHPCLDLDTALQKRTQYWIMTFYSPAFLTMPCFPGDGVPLATIGLIGSLALPSLSYVNLDIYSETGMALTEHGKGREQGPVPWIASFDGWPLQDALLLGLPAAWRRAPGP